MALTKNPSPALRRQIDLATAVCQERLLNTHVRHVLGLVELVSDRLPFDEALDIYVRIMRLTPEQARNIGSRALAELGRRTGLEPVEELKLHPVEDEEPQPEHPEGEGPEGQERQQGEGGRSDAVFSRLRRRIRGRVQDELRLRIDLAAARAEDALLETHIENTLTFIRALDDEVVAPEAAELYLNILAVDEGVGDVIYNRALRTIAETVLPPLASPDEVRSAPPPAPEQVRVVENRV